MQKECDKKIQKKSIEVPFFVTVENEFAKESGFKRISNDWLKNDLDTPELECQISQEKSLVNDLEFENICLEKMIREAKKEQVLLREEIDRLVAFNLLASK